MHGRPLCIVLQQPLMHRCCHITGRRGSPSDRDTGREAEDERGGGGEREGMAAVFGFQSSPSGKGCAESGLCPLAQLQPSKGTRVLCVFVGGECILLSPLLPCQTSPNPPSDASLLPAAHLYTVPLVPGPFRLGAVPKATLRLARYLVCIIS